MIYTLIDPTATYELMEKIYQNDITWGSNLQIHKIGKKFSEERKFLPLKGICKQIKHYNTKKSIEVVWQYTLKQEISIMLTDPNKESHYSIDTDSMYGIPITGERGHLSIYEISIQVEDFKDPAEPNACIEQRFYECVQEEVLTLMKKVE